MGSMDLKHGHFEWIVDWEHLARFLVPAALGLKSAASALDIGCGTSRLPLQLSEIAGIASVTAIDREAGVVRHMHELHGHSPGVRWIACDLLQSDTDVPPSVCKVISAWKHRKDCSCHSIS